MSDDRVGIGVQWEVRAESDFRVKALVPGGPAEQSGLKVRRVRVLPVASCGLMCFV